MTSLYNKLSSPLHTIKSHYDVVVIGSGYGGGVASSRLSRAGQSVCVLERGKEFLPGDFPDKPSEAIPEFQLDLEGRHIGAETALYDMRVNEDMNVVVGCGLGGTSLINANVSLQAERWVLEDTRWPEVLRQESIQSASPLQLGYERATAMLRPALLPDQPELLKFKAHQQSAQQLTGEFYKTPINVNFTGELSPSGVKQQACNHCGDCVSGCNVGAKNTTAMNYLPDAVNHGADIFCEVKVSHIERAGDQWRIYYQPHALARDIFDAPLLFVIAKQVVVAAGTLGSTELMLRSKQKGLAVSNRLGKGFTGNGDVLAFGYNCDQAINGIGVGTGIGDENVDPVGPCITAVIDDRREAAEQGMVIEEGVMPAAMAPLLPAMLAAANAALGEDTDEGFWDGFKERMRGAQSFFQGAYSGAVRNTQTYLVMSHDDSQGELQLQDNRLRVNWPGVGSQPIFNTISDRLKQATTALGGSYLRNPIWNKWVGHDLVTVHPLGGCAMADQAESGVVNDRCQVFSNDAGSEVYENLYICDGSIVPRSLGVNPLLTISALTERACHLMAQDKGWAENYSLNSEPQAVSSEAALGIQFTEKMCGYLSLDSSLDFAAAEADGEQQGQPFDFTLTVSSDDLATMLSEQHHRAVMLGTVNAPVLSDQPLMAVDGEFQLFYRDPDHVGRRLMDYRMRLIDVDGREYYFRGYKVVEDDPGFDMWADTTTLFIALHDGSNEQAPLMGRGVLHIKPADFAKQMTTMKARNAASKMEALKAVAQFGAFFSGAVAESYGGPLAPFRVHDADAPERVHRPLRVCEPELHSVITDDNVELLLSRYRDPSRTEHYGPVMLVHGLGVSSKIFSLDTIETNLLEYLYEAGFDVWLLDFRASIELPASNNRFNADDVANYDYPAAVAKILAVTAADNIQVVAHCFGGCTMSMSLLSGLQGVRSVVFSQVATHYEGALIGELKTGLHIPTLLEKLGVDSMTAYRDSHANWLSKLYDRALAFQPQQHEEWSNSPVDKRITFMYGQLWETSNLNRDTHDNLHELFGVANIESLQHLALMMRKGHAVNNQGDESYLPNVNNMKIPTLFIHGAENQTYLPVSTQKAVEFLSEANGEQWYDVKIIPNYGHIDCIFGSNAAADVYPHIKEHLQQY